MDVKIIEREAERVAFVRNIGPYESCMQSWEKLCQWAGVRGLFGPNTRFYGIGHDDPSTTPPEEIRCDCCITVGDDVIAEGEVKLQDIPAGKYGVFLLKGPYSKLKDTYRALYCEWLPQSGHKPANFPPFERYINDCHSTPPEELLTEVYIPLQ